MTYKRGFNFGYCVSQSVSLYVCTSVRGVAVKCVILTINSSCYIDGQMNYLDFYIIPMLYHRDSSDFLPNLKKKIFFQNCIKLIKNYFLTDFYDFKVKKKNFIFFYKGPPFLFFLCQTLKFIFLPRLYQIDKKLLFNSFLRF